MKKFLIYTGFAFACVLVVAVFITAKSYTQLAVAIILYPPLAYFALKVMSQKTPATPLTATIQPQVPVIPSNNTVTNPIQNKVEIIDVDKRTFLKLIGTAGISFFIFSLLGRRVDDIVFGKALQSQIGKIGYSPEDQITQTQPISEGYRITEIDDNVVSYYGFVNKDGNWLIMREDTENSSFRYAKGDTNFSQNWNDREKLNYVYYHNLF